jgi:tetratricopeptide (TPR) repeat protein
VKRPQWITIFISFFLVIALFAASKNTLFGERKAKTIAPADAHTDDTFTTDSVLFYSKQFLSQEQAQKLNTLENSISRGDVTGQKLSLYHQLAHFWKDSAHIFPPYAHYTAEAARLENSEKSLTFAAHLFLENLVNEQDHRLKQWEATQAKDLFERSLKINSNNDSSKVGLGAVYLYGGSAQPMEGIKLIRDVADRDSANVFAHMTLGKASLLSGQIDKAVERFKTVMRLNPQNVEGILLLAETYERADNKSLAIEWYRKSLNLVTNPEFQKEVTRRIEQLKK